MVPASETWNDCLASLSLKYNDHIVSTWFKPLVADTGEYPSHLLLYAPNKFMCDFLDHNYKESILSILHSVSPVIQSLTFLPRAQRENTESRREASFQNTKRTSFPPITNSVSPVRSQLNPRFSFDSFVVGSGNEFAKSAACAVAESPGKTKFNPLLIYGGVGLGKTHLLHAIGNFCCNTFSDKVVTYTTSEEFYLHFIEAIKNNETKKFSSVFRSCDVLLMDDVQFLSGKESTQEEFFYVFNTLYQNFKQIVCTSDLPPSSLKGLQDRLISRFQWGLCVDIQPPDLETRVAILKKKAEEDNLLLPENILYFIAENVSSNIRELEGIVIRLLAFASITKSDITLDLVKNLLNKNHHPQSRKISIDDIIEKVAAFYKVPVNNIREKNRRKEVAHCRHCAMFLSKILTNNSLKTIGLHFGGRDHSTVIHAVHQIEKSKNRDESFANELNIIISQLKD